MLVGCWSRETSRQCRTISSIHPANECPGVLLIPSGRRVGAVIEGLLMVWLNWMSDDLRNQIRWIP
jgi:hypothetical protein